MRMGCNVLIGLRIFIGLGRTFEWGWGDYNVSY